MRQLASCGGLGVFVVCVVSAPLAIGQQPAVLQAPQAVRVVGLGDADGVLGGAGPDYKVSFRDGAMEFVPALGERAPENGSVRYELQSVARGEVVLWTAEGGVTPAKRPGAHRGWAAVAYERAGGPTELYELRPGGLEQSFTFAQRPAGRGDLVVRGRLTGAAFLSERSLEADGALLLSAPGLGGVRVGSVVGRDAAGAQVAGALRLDGDTLELSLPSAFVDAATYPLVLDPLYDVAIPVTTVAQPIHAHDIAYDAQYDTWLIVWEQRYSAVDNDIYGVFAASDGHLSALLPIELSTNLDTGAVVAGCRLTDRFLVAWRRTQAGLQSGRGCTVSAFDGSLSQQGALFGASQSGDRIALGGNATLDDAACLLVWSDIAGAHGVRVTAPASGPPVAGTPFVVGPAGEYNPHIAASGGPLGNYLVAWEAYPSVAAKMIDRFGNTIIPRTIVANPISGSTGLKLPVVDGDGSRWAVAYRQFGVGSGVVRVQYNGPAFAVGPDYPAPSTIEVGTQLGVSFSGPYYFVARTYGTSPLGPELLLEGFEPFDFIPCEGSSTFAAAGTQLAFANPTLSSQYEGAAVPGVYSMAAWVTELAGNQTLWVQPVTNYNLGAGGVANLGGGCGIAGLLSALNSPPAMGNLAFGLQLSGVGPGVSTSYFNFNLPGLAATCGPCTWMPVWLYFAVPVSSGIALLPLPLYCNPVLYGVTIEAQGITVLPGTGPCPNFPKLSFSNRLSLTIQ